MFRRDTGGDEFGQLYRYDVQDGRITLLTDGGRSQNSLGVWSHKGDRLAYTTTRRNGADRDVHVMDPAESGNRPPRPSGEQGAGGTSWTGPPTTGRCSIVEEISIEESHLWLVDVATGQRTQLTPSGERVSYGLAVFSRDGRGVFLTTDKASEFLRLAYLDLSTRAMTTLTGDINWDVENIELSPDGRTHGLRHQRGRDFAAAADGHRHARGPAARRRSDRRDRRAPLAPGGQ